MKLPFLSYRDRPESDLLAALRQKIRLQPVLFWFGAILMVGSVPLVFLDDDIILAVLVFLLGMYAYLNAETIEVFRDYLERKGHLPEVENAPPRRTNKALWLVAGIVLALGWVLLRAIMSN